MTTELRKAETPDQIDIYQKRDPYREWLDAEGVKVIVDYKFPDLNTVELGPWERNGGMGSVINMPITAPPNDDHTSVRLHSTHPPVNRRDGPKRDRWREDIDRVRRPSHRRAMS